MSLNKLDINTLKLIALNINHPHPGSNSKRELISFIKKHPLVTNCDVYDYQISPYCWNRRNYDIFATRLGINPYLYKSNDEIRNAVENKLSSCHSIGFVRRDGEKESSIEEDDSGDYKLLS